MSEPKIADIISLIENFASPSFQENWDNTGWQLCDGPVSNVCSGVMLCLDVTPEVVDEAAGYGCNLIISHHPLLFRGLKQITGSSPAQRALLKAIRAGIYIYSSHTALDSAPSGVSHKLGEMLGLENMRVLSPRPGNTDVGLGVVGEYMEKLSPGEFVKRVKRVYGAETVRVSEGPEGLDGVRSVALCSGSGGEFIPAAVAERADAYITSDTRYHDFVDYGKDILIVDTGHYESEICTKSIFSAIISEKFPNFAVRKSRAEHPPVRYV